MREFDVALYGHLSYDNIWQDEKFKTFIRNTTFDGGRHHNRISNI
jgi:hypothetical protein